MGISDMTGISVFAKCRDGHVYHTYSTYARGMDMLNGAYHILDLLPKGATRIIFHSPCRG